MYSLSVPKENNSHEKIEAEKSVERMMDTYGRDVLRVAFLYLKDKHRAEDAFQEVFLRVYKKYNSFKHESSEKTWLIRITVNVCKDYLKSSWIKRVLLIDSVKPEDTVPNIDTEVIRMEENKFLFKEVLALPSLFKDVIVLFYYQEFSIIEISKILGIPEGTVRSRMHRAREMLKKNLKGRMDRHD